MDLRRYRPTKSSALLLTPWFLDGPPIPLTARELSRPPEVLGVAPSGLADAPYVRSQCGRSHGAGDIL